MLLVTEITSSGEPIDCPAVVVSAFVDRMGMGAMGHCSLNLRNMYYCWLYFPLWDKYTTYFVCVEYYLQLTTFLFP